MKNLQLKRGFTLIELLVVIAIIAMLSSVVLASLNSARVKARDARRLADIRQIQTALELYFDSVANPEYPDALADLSPTYISAVPTDPRSGNDYIYKNLTGNNTNCAVLTGKCTRYILRAFLENGTHSALSSDVDGTITDVACNDPNNYCVQP